MIRALSFLLLLTAGILTQGVWAAEIAVVYPERSVAASERGYAKALAGHIRRWYAEAGVEADLVAEGNLSARQGHSLIFLVDCHTPPQETLAEVRAGLSAGKRFVVCYSGSDDLARLFGLRAAGYRRNGPWRSMRFLENRPRGAPTAILQTSDNLFAMRAGDSAAVKPMAWWLNAAGRPTEVAWWRTVRGSYWMTHVLTGDGDEADKRRLVLAIAAESIPGVWERAARTVRDEALEPLRDGSLSARLRRLPRELSETRGMERALALMRAQQTATERALRKGGAEAYQAALDLRTLVSRVYGKTFHAPLDETRAVWDHSGQGLWPDDWGRTAATLAAHGITDVYVNVAGAAFALYPSLVLPRKGSRDRLAEAVAACHKHGLRVHAWLLAFSCERAASPEAVRGFKKRGWTLQDPAGQDLNWLDPTHPAVRQRLVDSVREIATNYEVDGIHLDFIRFPGLPQSLGPRTRARFEATAGKAAGWPECVTDANGSARARFLRWRAEQVADAVQGVRAWLHANKPAIALSAAVYGKYPSCVDSVGQDWLSWLRAGLIDVAVPMNYTEDPARLSDWLGTQTADPRLAARIVSGVGVTASESRLSAVQAMRQIETARQAGCRGFALFDLDETLRTDILPVLRESITTP